MKQFALSLHVNKSWELNLHPFFLGGVCNYGSFFLSLLFFWIDEWIFDSSYGHATPNRPPATSKHKDGKQSSSEPISLVLGKGSMIEGWECALRCMEKGECAEVIIKSA
jgi:hypothetical protein